ncbi:MAG: type IV pilus modification PilV family protein [Polyangiales bacterium]
MTRQNEHQRSGFTLVEVMIAIGIMTVGSLGILSMHQAIGQANRAAHEMNTALTITERWIERIERDTLNWTEAGQASPSLTTRTDYLVPLTATNNETAWFRPAPPSDEESYSFDHFGNDINNGDPAKFCTNIRLSWIRLGASARVDVRTFWYREGHMGGAATHPNWVTGTAFRNADCDAATADGWNLSTGMVPNIEVVHASTMIRWLRREGT